MTVIGFEQRGVLSPYHPGTHRAVDKPVRAVIILWEVDRPNKGSLAGVRQCLADL